MTLTADQRTLYPLSNEFDPDRRFDEVRARIEQMSNLLTIRSDVFSILATVHDITQQHRLSQRLEQHAQGLQQLVEDQTLKLRQSEGRLMKRLTEHLRSELGDLGQIDFGPG